MKWNRWKRLIVGGVFSWMLLSLYTHTEAAELAVSPNQSLQDVINQANAGDKLVLEKGIYKGPFHLTKSLTITGENGAVLDGQGEGSVLTIQAKDVTIENLSIQNSGKGKEDSGVYVLEGGNHIITQNQMEDVMNGVFVEKSQSVRILENVVTSFAGGIYDRGNGIHLLRGAGHTIQGNTIDLVQDGVYLDFAKEIYLERNEITQSRYAFHFMFSDNILTKRNRLADNITGMMIMNSAQLELMENEIIDHFDFRGFGIIMYESEAIVLAENELKRNSTGLSLENTKDVSISRNQISGNQVGLEFKKKNEGSQFTENNFIGNVVQSKITDDEMRLDNGELGNYWDDYGSFDVTGDGIGEVTYKAGSLYDQLLDRQPYWQFFFESPAVKLWSKAETLFPSIGVEVYDGKPLVQPVDLQENNGKQGEKKNESVLITAILFLALSLFLIWKGRKLS
ncbi:nitrous oxide reductase family maturation protein NosD [Cytobacillus spongiae]|uniref:nitrous oxide reductase family maturation protein NosD n=1 Tax=Cytobacillus spongiae TaxID=2901381 RepID=UPI001F3B71FA|nr:nitrous oxide reductase family maturation protein NosD [Cytobacillus spongiae]UII56164.1 nitrous oxide reductase family maturation protein NosD [Cytobacillus spongiae]